MSSTITHDVSVLVVGAGPAGLAAALELARHDIPTLLVERRGDRSPHPRATVLSLRSMELARGWGLEDQMRTRSVEVDWRMLFCDSLAQAAAGTAHAVGYPSAEQSRMLSPTAPACVAQDEVEPLLLEHLHTAAPRTDVRLNTELAGLLVRPDGVRAQLHDLRTGGSSTVRARYAVAADGAYSAVRTALGIPLLGADGVMKGTTALFRAPLWEVAGPHRHVIYSIGEVGSLIPTGPSDRWLFGSASPFDASRLLDEIRRAAGVPDLPVQVERWGSFAAAAQVAERWRSGPVFLAGDAAHRVTPRGGTGLNIALHDGYDLGWRLAWVLSGWAPPALLDGYEAERRPVAEHVVARSADPQGSLRPVEQEVRVDIGGRIPHVISDGRSTLDLLAPGLTLFAAQDEPGWEQAAATLDRGAPVTLRRIEPVAARAIGAVAGSALLARSDGVPVVVLPGRRV
jgi:putative polyketide hydroxylase